MSPSKKPLEIVVYQDPLCAWCYLADRRLTTVRRELGDAFVWRARPFALRIKDAALTEKERQDWAKEVEEAKLEPDAAALTRTLWEGPDLPRSSLPALIALEAARMQGRDAQKALAQAMQRAAMEGGVNVTRDDVVFELAQGSGLNMGKFAAAIRSPDIKTLVLDGHRQAESRGVKGVPCLVIAGRWMLSGLRTEQEYRDQLLECLQKSERPGDVVLH